MRRCLLLVLSTLAACSDDGDDDGEGGCWERTYKIETCAEDSPDACGLCGTGCLFVGNEYACARPCESDADCPDSEECRPDAASCTTCQDAVQICVPK